MNVAAQHSHEIQLVNGHWMEANVVGVQDAGNALQRRRKHRCRLIRNLRYPQFWRKPTRSSRAGTGYCLTSSLRISWCCCCCNWVHTLCLARQQTMCMMKGTGRAVYVCVQFRMVSTMELLTLAEWPRKSSRFAN